MRHIVIASHHRFATGLKDTLEFVVGNIGIIDISAYVDETCLDERVDAVFSAFSPQDEVLVLTDMLQGSVNQAFRKYMNERVFLITGVNLPCALELVSAGEPLTPGAIRDAIDRAREQLLFVNDYVMDIGEEDE